ncbi:hypothetical protein AwWohl_13910 [Gammaproteobacteria bacterium]|nr:hypothetical protein AwWohl_13910 [Gammaproteobacteria bacterium]
MRPIADLPEPNEDARALSAMLAMQIKMRIKSSKTETISFAEYFDACLYMPNLGYYSNDLRKFGQAGDFITAPELSPLFSQCIANQILEISEHLADFNIMEIGAGTGIMCADILDYLKSKLSLEMLPVHYYILERSGTLRERQQQLLKLRHPDYFKNIIWLDSPLKHPFEAIIIGNEIIDALSVARFTILDQIPYYLDIALDKYDQFIWNKRVLNKNIHDLDYQNLLDFIANLKDKNIELPDNYQSEFCPQLSPFINTITENLSKGALLLIDYGYTQKEYYHPLRTGGTLIAHYQHHAHEAFFEYIGLQDLTANVDFTALGEAGLSAGLSVLGYTNQALFLYGAGLEALLVSLHQQSSPSAWVRIAQKIQQLVLPAEMGERFQVMLMGKNLIELESEDETTLKCFSLRDFRHLL